MRGFVVVCLVCIPAAASAQSIDLKGWTSDGQPVVAIDPGAGEFAPAWDSSGEGGSVEAVCMPTPLDQVQIDGGDNGCTICADDKACGLAVDASATKSSLKSPDKKIKVTDKRKCAKDPDAYTGKSCTRTISFGKLGSFTYPEQWSDDKAPMKVFFRPDSGAALVTFFGSNRMDTTNVSMYVVDLGGGGGGGATAQILCGIVSDGQVTQVVPDKKKSRVGAVVQCAVRQTGGAAGTVKVQTSWKGHQGPEHTADIAPDKDAEIDLTPVDGDGAHPDFVPCTDFQIQATIGSWSQTVKVPQKCKKQPKGKLACTYTDSDGKKYDELKGRYRLPDDATLTCKLGGLDIADGVGDAWMDVKGSDATNRVHASLDPDTASLVFELPAADLAECDTTTFDVTVVDDENIPWFTKSVSLLEDCPD